MRPNSLRELFERKQFAVNGWLASNSAYTAEVLSRAGFDSVTVDLQHGMFGLDTAVSLIQAVSCGSAVPLARCSGLHASEIGKLLDAGAYGIICPSIDNATQCQDFVAACRYPPKGQRSYGPARGLLYGGPDYVDQADVNVLTFAMVESVAAMQNLEAILAVPGLDGVYVGPNDLAMSMGLIPAGGSLSPQVEEAMSAVVRAAHAVGRVAGAYCSTGEMGARLVAKGFDMVTPGNDIVILQDATAQRLAQVRGAAMPQAVAGY